ncbi:VOC family protein [Lewinella sp. W8]|uniref:VOC family protein n=1 Tax=Lewinella sp. W8 TaxID=2528208 RepID=UPI0010680990|nr:VOC family protein [Lewinella sp. W8]MTB53344.1 hypothetical protein [Lewinella sp. W8]
MYHIDHFVYLVHDLEGMADQIGHQLGVAFRPGGRHQDRGTRNVLLRVGPKTYLELLAIDPDNNAIAAPRWMGVDLLPPTVVGRLSRWAVATTGEQYDMSRRELAAISPAMGVSEPGSRQLADGSTLKWRLTAPGAEPAVRAAPFLIDWFGQLTPAEKLPEAGVSIRSFTGRHARQLPSFVRAVEGVTFTPGPEDVLRLELVGPAGQLVILTS